MQQVILHRPYRYIIEAVVVFSPFIANEMNMIEMLSFI